MDNLDAPPPIVSTPQSKNPNLKWYILLIILIAILVPSLTWNILSASSKNSLTGSDPIKTLSGDPSSFFDSQNAIVEGKITKINGNKITVENKRGATAEIALAENFFSNRSPIGTNSGLEQKIALNENVSINLIIVSGEYHANSLTFQSQPISTDKPTGTITSTQPAISTPPVATSSASPRSSAKPTSTFIPAESVLTAPIGTGVNAPALTIKDPED